MAEKVWWHKHEAVARLWKMSITRAYSYNSSNLTYYVLYIVHLWISNEYESSASKSGFPRQQNIISSLSLPLCCNAKHGTVKHPSKDVAIQSTTSNLTDMHCYVGTVVALVIFTDTDSEKFITTGSDSYAYNEYYISKWYRNNTWLISHLTCVIVVETTRRWHLLYEYGNML